MIYRIYFLFFYISMFLTFSLLYFILFLLLLFYSAYTFLGGLKARQSSRKNIYIYIDPVSILFISSSLIFRIAHFSLICRVFASTCFFVSNFIVCSSLLYCSKTLRFLLQFLRRIVHRLLRPLVASPGAARGLSQHPRGLAAREAMEGEKEGEEEKRERQRTWRK